MLFMGILVLSLQRNLITTLKNNSELLIIMVEHQSHPFWWHYLSHNKLVQIYCSLGIRTFALSLVALFIPLYLHFELGYSMQQTLLFYLVYAVIFAIASPIAVQPAKGLAKLPISIASASAAEPESTRLQSIIIFC